MHHDTQKIYKLFGNMYVTDLYSQNYFNLYINSIESNYVNGNKNTEQQEMLVAR